MNKRVLSGIRPTGKLHIGNYLGAINSWIRLQESEDCYFMIADWHVLTTDYESGASIKDTVLQVAIDLLSSGIDHNKCILFVQSSVQAHAELSLILSMITPLSWLERNPTYKEQMRELEGRELHTHGFLGYPVLQAADILLYRANSVPVGDDQLPHIELTREIARRFNYLYKKVFTEPEALLTNTPRIPGTDGRKMSKSYNNCLYLSDSRDDIQKKIKKMFTDPARKRKTDPGNPDKCPVCFYQNILNKDQVEEIKEGCRKATIGCSDCKKIFIEKCINFLEPIWEKRAWYEQHIPDIKEILACGTQRASEVANGILENVRNAIRI